MAAARAGINHSKCLRFSGGCGGRQRKIMTLQLHRFGERTQGAGKNLNFCVVFSPPLREKDDKYRTWMPTFLIAKEDKDQRKSGSNMERS